MDRYELGATIGRGGMGEVFAARDSEIGRDVALKRIRSEKATEAARQRFIREARIQARLDHPAIVPVHDIGTDDDGLPFFTMKRLAGRTLHDTLADAPPLAETLRAFAEVCHAIDFAHARGIIHRDLKPANIMLGDFGETYVLDWGVACALSEDRETPVPRATPIPRVRGGASTSDATTMAGALLGTAGYMAPEQMQSAAEVGTAADVYALGAVLFEILTGERLHPDGDAAIGSTLAGDTWSPAARRPDRAVPPELDALCASALSWDPEARPSAHDLALRIQRFLDGDRDIARRIALAARCLADAQAALASGSPDRRAEAVAAAGRALALDPESRDAAALVARLLIEPPPALPRELAAQLDRTDADMARQRGRNAALAYGSLLPLSLFVPFLRVRDWIPLVSLWLAIAFVMLIAWTTWRTGRVRTWLVLGSGVAMSVLMSRLAGPFMLAPTIICGTLFSVTALPRVVSHRWITAAWVTCAALVPLALEWLGILSPTASVIDGHLSMRSAIFETHGPLDLAALVTANLVFLLVCGFYAHRISRDRRLAERELQIRAWHLAKLLP
ncbi:MAG TPA: serine/threonine-protein kinase [Kofleriaceae bacterium]|jgi:serine/threonine-protein kinase